jgi:signal transduction histidine kinase
VDPRLPERLLALRNDERTQLELPLRGETATLLLHARRFELLGEPFTVVVCQDIRQELESRDVQAWQALTRVLTHEMMNSLTPIVTLSGHLRQSLQQVPGGEADIAESIEVIHERSSGLARFIETYRQFAHPPAPIPAHTVAADLLEHVARLKRPELDAQGIGLEVVDEARGARIHADARQIEQVLLNLIRNAQQALAGQSGARIELRSERDARDKVAIHVTDNGPGIAPALLGKAFVPFFTTRSGGTGIGLALSRQLMQLNQGTIVVDSQPGRCRFTLRLPQAR